jgi:serine phosphatase RsbU (regulator of sigma subunit)
LQVVELQKQDIEYKNQEITASITYALRIQNAILRTEIEMQKYLDCFVFFRPRDIVSGDFYWFTEKENCKILAVADCTGHGVSGALMTMIGNNLLNQIVHDKEIHEPDQILVQLQILLEKTLTTSQQNVKDGMDISIVRLSYPQGFKSSLGVMISYAGAMNPLYYVENQEFKEIKADKLPIGGRQSDKNFVYQQHNLQVSVSSNPLSVHTEQQQITDNYVLYLCSDGYQDQFGGENDKKFMVKNLKRLLLEISDKPLPVQKDILATTFDDWKGKREQTDDVLVVGVKI